MHRRLWERGSACPRPEQRSSLALLGKLPLLTQPTGGLTAHDE
jgi:hypothetical protein